MGKYKWVRDREPSSDVRHRIAYSCECEKGHSATARIKPTRHHVVGACKHAPSFIWRAINGCRTPPRAIGFMFGIQMQHQSWDFVPVSRRNAILKCASLVVRRRPHGSMSGWPCARVIMRYRVDEADKRPAPAR